MADQNSEMLNKRIEETLGNLETLKGEERAQAVKELDTLYKLRSGRWQIRRCRPAPGHRGGR